MKNQKTTFFALLFFVVICFPPEVQSLDHDCTTTNNHPTLKNRNGLLNGSELHAVICDRERTKMLFRDPELISTMLTQPAMREEMLRHPSLIRQMMLNREIRRELLQNEQMMHQMLWSRDINRDINNNSEMLAEIEKNETYRQINQEMQAELLKELLLETTSAKQLQLTPPP